MIRMSLPDIADVTGGAVHDDPGVFVTGPAFVDSRVAELEGLFVAVEGERVDGHEFAGAAIRSGAAAVLAQRPVGVPAVVVEDSVAALGKLARHVLAELPDLKVVAITGSQGKTSAKDLLTQVLREAGTTVATAGSFNNELGLPLTALVADHETQFLVLEMGAKAVGDLTYLCQIAPPDVALVLNVGKAHIGEFGSQADIARAKGELVEALHPGGVAVLNHDDPLVAAMAKRSRGRVTTYGEGIGADLLVSGLTVDELGRAGFDLTRDGDSAHLQLSLIGEHQASNAAAAAAVALVLGLPLDRTATALASATPTSQWRMELHETADGVTVINDAYNANPDSMKAALKALAAIGSGHDDRRTIAVLGEMRELGAASREEHDAIGRLAVRLDIRQLLVVGEEARAIHLGASQEGSWGEESVFVADADQALAWLTENFTAGDVVLVKASRAVELEKVADAILAIRPRIQKR